MSRILPQIYVYVPLINKNKKKIYTNNAFFLDFMEFYIFFGFMEFYIFFGFMEFYIIN